MRAVRGLVLSVAGLGLGLVLVLGLESCGSSAPAPDAGQVAPDAGQVVPDAGPAVFGEVTVLRVSDIPVPLPAEPIDSGFGPGVTFSDYVSARRVAIADFDQDGALDLFVAPTLLLGTPELPVAIWLNDGRGQFRDATADVISGPVPTTGSVNGVFVDDLNGDGAPDVFIVDQGDEWPQPPLGERNKLLLSTGDGRLQDVTDSALPDQPRRFNHVSAEADVNRDGCPDFAVPSLGAENGIGLWLYVGDCHGGFVATSAALPPEIAGHLGWTPGINYQIVGAPGLADLDGDGIVDLVTGTYNYRDDVTLVHTLRFFRGSESGDFGETARLPAPEAVDVPYTGSDETLRAGVAGITPGDIDGDGRPDLLVQYETSTLSYVVILHNDGDFAFSDVTLAWRGHYETSSPYQDLWGNPIVPFENDRYQLVDVDADGRLDLVRGPIKDLMVADLAGDSFLELNDGDGHFVVWKATKNGLPASAFDIEGLFPASVPALERGGHPFVFDADGDGVRDIVFISGRHVPHATATTSVMTDLARVFVFPATGH